ncbi:flagellar protein FlaG [Permianibacter aggregans]|uniref:Putative FlaG/YvyC family protein n=1 Tax=Permianibacter aggregans TaxID=1510150 RepID=A0A4R6UQW4_9GAMM|nr:flagellar protein FlaG [Permianibacter aggregans]QGX38288.1 flagellar protein FlaG [Permianibacter aggregans]TDQ48606.1 putative FlaG/YvyC family protein [Permianibacter aggregans]
MASDTSINSPSLPVATATITTLPRPEPEQKLVEQAVSEALASNTENGESLSEQQLIETINALNDNAFVIKRSLQFNVDEQTGTTIITVRNSQTDEVIRQIPSEALLKLAQRIEALSETQKEAQGLFLQSEI